MTSWDSGHFLVNLVENSEDGVIKHDWLRNLLTLNSDVVES